jgi:aminopeptidase N
VAKNLTRDEAQSRSALVSDVSYDVTLDLRYGEEVFDSRTVLRFRCSEPGAATFLELIAPRLRSATLNGTQLPAAAFDGYRLQLTGLAEHNELVVDAECAYMNTGEGLHRFVDPIDKRVYLYTQFETYDAHRVFACFDQPDLKGPFTLTVEAPEEWVVVSNGRVSERPTEGAAGTWRFETTPPVSTYFTAVVAGPYSSVHDVHGDIPLGIYCRRSLFEFLDPEEILTVTKQGFDWFTEAFGRPYAFTKYDQLFVPEFNAGAMENAGCVTFLEDYVFRSKVTDAARERRAETILHEMAHMWFGDLVTMRWWDDLWLNESFATYVSVLCQADATRFTGAWTTFANNEKTWAYKQDQLPSTHPVVADMVDMHAVEVNFDGITYAKGASVLKQLVAWVGQDRFLAGMKTYFERHAWGNTELRDLLRVLEEASGRDLSLWSKEWLETAGVNTLRAEFELADDGTFAAFRLLQESPSDWPTLRSHRVAIGLYDLEGSGVLARRHRVELDVTGAVTDVPSLVGQRQPDLVLVNDDDLTYAKIRLDERSLATAVAHLGKLPDSLPRALCWAAAWDMTRDAEMAARDYLALVLANIGSESDIGVVQTLLAQCQAAIFAFGDPANRAAALQLLNAGALDFLRSAPPGSDHQLAWARAWVATSRANEDLTAVRGLLTGATAFDGLAVDTDLRWHVVRSLAARGVLTEDEITAEAERDPTAAGQRQAAAARAARPTAEAKAEAWTAIVDDTELPNAVLSALLGGFMQHEQADLIRPYVEPYFAVVPRLWSSRTSEVAINILTGAYPHVLIEPETLERTDAYLAQGTVEPSVRRVLIESRDGVARALRARERDRG